MGPQTTEWQNGWYYGGSKTVCSFVTMVLLLGWIEVVAAKAPQMWLSLHQAWLTMEDLGSDHMPIIIEVKHENTQRHSMKQRRTRWKRTKADWGSFTEQIGKKLDSAETPEPVSFPLKVANFNKLLVRAGYDHHSRSTEKAKFITPGSW